MKNRKINNKKNKNEFIIHIGFPKTGTKALQRHVFPKLKGLHYLNKSNKNIKKLIELDILQKDYIEFNTNNSVKLLSSEIEKKIYINNKFLISYEDLSFTRDNRTDRTIIANKLKTIFCNVKIIIVVRNQFSFLSSMYKQTIKGGSFMSPKTFLDSFWFKYHKSFFPQLKYYSFIKFYEDLMGKENILVLCYEDFKKNTDNFINQICKFIGVETINKNIPYENIGFSKSALIIKRFLNRIIRYDLGRAYYLPGVRQAGTKAKKTNFRYLYKIVTNIFINKIDKIFNFKKFKIEFTEEWEKRIKDLYSEENIKLANEYNLKLDEFDYPMN